MGIWNPGPPETWLKIELKPMTEEEKEKIRVEIAKKIAERRAREKPYEKPYIPPEVLWRRLD